MTNFCLMKRMTGFLVPVLALAGCVGSAFPSQRTALPGPATYIDLSADTTRQIIVDRERGQYLGHPTTLLLEDKKTILIVYPKGHGAGQIVLKKSVDTGLTWSERLPVPENWSTSKEVPTLFRVIDQAGFKRVILFSGLYPARMSVSSDEGSTWTPLTPVGDWGGIVVMGSVERLRDGRYLALFHDDGRFFTKEGKRTSSMTLYKTTSANGGRTWSLPEAFFSADTVHLCEPGLVRSPSGSQLAILLRENTRTHRSFIMFSDDEGEHWTSPRELPLTLTGDRHTAKYAPDGRLLISFRHMDRSASSYGDWVAWAGTYDDLLNGHQGQYLVRLMDNTKDADCAYPGVEILPDSTFVLTTYGHWVKGEQPFIISVRLRIDELDRMLSSEQK